MTRPGTKNEPASGQDEGVSVGQDFVLFPDRQIAALDTPTGKAFEAKDRRNGRSVYGLVCKGGVVPRMTAIRSLVGVERAGMLTLRAWQIVDWTGPDRRVLALVIDQPPGPSIAERRPRIEPNRIGERLVRPIAELLRGFEALEFGHRNIRSANVFFPRGEGSPVVGECVSGPAGFSQPAVYEPMPRALAIPAARGEGNVQDDLYALGALICEVAGARSLMGSASNETAVVRRLEMGSPSALIGDTSLPRSLLDLIRGLTSDIPQDRWSLDDVFRWLDGGLTPAVRPVSGKRASRRLEIGNATYGTPRSVAYGLWRHWAAAAGVAASGHLLKWLRNGHRDEELATKVGALLDGGLTSGGEANDRMLARICRTLDPDGPVRFRRISAMPDGFASLIATSMYDSELRADVMELFSALAAADTGSATHPDKAHSRFVVSYGGLRRRVLSRQPWEGLERAAYQLNPDMACASPLVAKKYAVDLGQLLRALDKAAGGKDAQPVDAHITAFVAARLNKRVGNVIKANSRSARQSVPLVQLRLLAAAQTDAGTGRLVSLAARLRTMCEPELVGFRSEGTRRQARNLLELAAERGKLKDMVSVFDDTDRIVRDARDYEAAKAKYARNLRELARLRDLRQPADRNLLDRARSLVARLSLAASVAIGVSIGLALSI